MTENNQTAEPVKVDSKIVPKNIRLMGQFDAVASDGSKARLDGAGLIFKGKDQSYVGSNPVAFSGKVSQTLVDKAIGFAHAHLHHVNVKPSKENLQELDDGITSTINEIFQNKSELPFAVKFNFEFNLATRTFTFRPTKGQEKRWTIVEELVGKKEAELLTLNKLVSLI
ncbi:MAG: hypothetical protein J5897_06485 [Candidatus Methanomethylophilus sp.]|nr:hypothetical protein [Methanomethylophilus sp.]